MNALMFINTTGLEFDDRVRKEALSLKERGLDVEIVALEYRNLPSVTLAYDEIPAQTVHLRSRGLFSRQSGLIIKTIEMYLRMLLYAAKRRRDIMWIHNIEMIGLIPVFSVLKSLGVIQRIVWDQHELPNDSWTNNFWFLTIYTWCCNQCDGLVMANQQRQDVIQEFVPNVRTPITILQNFPDERFRLLPKSELPKEVTTWLQGTPYLLAQGGANPDRNFRELADAVMKLRSIKLVIVGPYQKQQLDELTVEYGTLWHEYILLTGFVPQLEISAYIDNATASVVFYTMTTLNTKLCAPNRLYQALSRSVPVIVSPNPPMVDLVERFTCGIVVDPTDPQCIRHGISELIQFETKFRENAVACSTEFTWEHQQFPSFIPLQAHHEIFWDN